MTRFPFWEKQILEKLYKPVDGSSLAVFRILFGLLMCAGSLRFMAEGWIEPVFTEPKFYFKYPFFSWVKPWSAEGMYLHYSLQAFFALLIALGLFYRLSLFLFFMLFSYAQLIDVTNYLNHYYLVILLCILIFPMPLAKLWSLDAYLKKRKGKSEAPYISYGWILILRLQLCIVYVSAALAKTGEDWLLYAQPMNIWMSSRNEIWLIGPFLDEIWLAYLLSWGGFLYDLTISFFLLKPFTRLYAYFMVCIFHFFTGVFFDIGLFPWIMTFSTLLFFDPDWPKRFLNKAFKTGQNFNDSSAVEKNQLDLLRTKFFPYLFVIFFTIQIFLPVRSYLLYGGNVLWHEQGMRFSWRVMVREKSGSIIYKASSRNLSKSWEISPGRYLNLRQEAEFSGQPDLILQLAKKIEKDFHEQGIKDIEIRVEARVSLNGRKPSLLIDPNVDLTKLKDSILPAEWILPAPKEAASRLN